MRILVAMSGGIDSSVVAHLLQEKGHDLVGVRFTLWSDPLAPALAKVLPRKCCNAQTAARAKAVAGKLGIPYHIVDLEEEFKKEVVDPFLEAYSKGLSPNPCIRCNRTIKFGKLLEIADELGCEKIATGHYARVARVMVSPSKDDTYHLLEAIDKSKDQSYYLYGLTQQQLARVMFPLGYMYKSEVYSLAKRFSVPYDEESYRESQDLCFFPEKTPQAFLRRHLRSSLRPGNIVRRSGEVLGRHEGVQLYTIGQRRGLRIGGLRIPLEVVQKDLSTHTLVVADRATEKVQEVPLASLSFVSSKPEENVPILLLSRNRSLGGLSPGVLSYYDSSGMYRFSSPQPLQAPGQHLVFYRHEEVIGGGVISLQDNKNLL